MDEVVRGEPGYWDWCLQLIEAGHCSCQGCGGHLQDDLCLSCGCGHRVMEGSRFQRRGPIWIPNHVAGRCAVADEHHAQWRREHEREERRRRLAESHGDPQQ